MKQLEKIAPKVCKLTGGGAKESSFSGMVAETAVLDGAGTLAGLAGFEKF